MVCVIDDDPSLRRALHRLLTAAAFDVKEFASAEDFLRAQPIACLGCLVLDVHLGGLSGFELQERLTASRCAVPVIFITAHDDAPTRERARKAGAAGYLPKPFDDESLIHAIADTLRPAGP